MVIAGRKGRPALVGKAHVPVVGGFSCDPTKLNVLLVFCPIVVMAAMQTTTIMASITAYSTAVGPSSFFRKLTIQLPAR